MIHLLLRWDGRVVALAAVQLFQCYLIWAALHDIAQQLSTSYAVEYTFLTIVPITIIVVWCIAFRILTATGRLVWTTVFAIWVILLDYAAYDSLATGWTRTGGSLERAVLIASVPLLALLCALFAINVRAADRT